VQSPPAPAASSAVPEVPEQATSVDTTLPLWTIDYGESSITFVAEQAGAPFTGTWPAWSAEIRFAPENPAAGSAQVRVDVTQPATGDENRDGTMASTEWFDSVTHPEVLYRTIDITPRTEGGYSATGMLRIRNAEYPVVLSFEHLLDDATEVITGTAMLDRLALNLGTGEWADTSQVGQAVRVDFKVVRAAGS
jgi:polyisoprenoid-binding protein YceI